MENFDQNNHGVNVGSKHMSGHRISRESVGGIPVPGEDWEEDQDQAADGRGEGAEDLQLGLWTGRSGSGSSSKYFKLSGRGNKFKS